MPDDFMGSRKEGGKGFRKRKGSGSAPLPGVLLHGEASGIFLDGTFANALHICQVCGNCKRTIRFAIGNDGFGLALANAVQAGEGSHIGRVDIDSGVLGVGKTGNQAEQRTSVAKSGVRFIDTSS